MNDEQTASASSTTVIETEIDTTEVTTAIAKVNAETGIAESDREKLRGAFEPFFGDLVTWAKSAAGVSADRKDDPKQQKLARSVRLGLKSVRCETDRARKALKASALNYGRAVDGYAGVITRISERIESRMEEIEKYALNEEAKRIARMIEQRTRELTELGHDTSVYNLGTMTETQYLAVLDRARNEKTARDAAAAKEKAEREAREAAERAEKDKLSAENERLAKENAAREAEAKAAREAQEAAEAEARRKIDEAEARARAEREAAEAKAKAERDAAEAKARAEAAEAEAKLRAANEARAAAEAEYREAALREERRKIAEAKAAADKARAEQDAKDAAARAPDKQKIMSFAARVRFLGVGAMSSERGTALAAQIVQQRDKFAAWIETQAEGL